MPQVELSSLTGPELRRLLDTSRARGQASLTYQILQEMAARRDAPRPPARLSLLRRPKEPRVVALRLDEPLDLEDDPGPEVAAASPPEPEPPPKRGPGRRKTPPAPAEPIVEAAPPPPKPRGVWDSEPEPPEPPKAWTLPLPPLTLDGVRPPARLGGGAAAGFAVGIALGVAGGWFGGAVLRPAQATSVAPVAAELQIAELAPAAPAPPPVAEGPTLAETPPEPTDGLSPPPVEAPATSPDTADLAQDAATQAAEGPPTEASAPADACASQPTPADRRICGDPELRRLQRDLRQAYAEALVVHQERDLLRQRQLAWASARDGVSDPDRLAGLYEDRIRRLNAAAAAARQQR